MFTCIRPMLGLSAAFISVVAILGCQKQPEDSPWRLKQPVLRWEDERGIAKSANATGSRNMNNGLFAVLEFSAEDRGLPITASTQCRSGTAVTTATATKIMAKTTAETAAELSLARLIPSAIFAPYQVDQGWICQIELTAYHPTGNTHTFTLHNLGFRVPKENQPAMIVAAFTPLESAGAQTLALVCPKWTVQETTASTGAITRERIQALSANSVVDGDDTRATERRPTCTLLIDGPTQRQRLGLITLQFHPPQLTVTLPSSPLLANEDSMRLFQKAVLKWTVTLDDDQRTTLAFPKMLLRGRMISPGRFQSRAVKLPYHLEYDGAHFIRRTDGTDFVEIEGRKTIAVTMILDRRLFCYYTPVSDHWEIASQLRLEAEHPLRVETIANADGQLNSQVNSKLKGKLTDGAFDERDPVELLTSVILIPPERPGTSVLVLPNTGAQIEPKIDDTRCITGDQFTLDPAAMVSPEE